MMTPFKILAMTIVSLLLTSVASAQSGNSGGGTTGTGANTGTTAGSSTTGQTSTGGTPTGQSGTMGSGLSGQSSFAGTVPGESTATSNATQAFVGSNATQGFIGGSSLAATEQAINRQFQAIQNNQSQQSTGQATGTPREIRTTLRVGFSFPTASQSQLIGGLADANIASLSRFTSDRPELAGIDVALNSSGVAILTGSTPTVETSRLAANLMRLQPGVRRVENQITVPVN